MFNYYTHEKNSTKKQLAGQGNDRESEVKTREVLSRRYKNRVNNDLIELNHNLVNLPSRSRSPESSIFEVGNARNSKSRTNKYSMLDSVPSPTRAFSLRSREKTKEIQPPLRFKFLGSDRLKESIETQRKFLDTSTTLQPLNIDYSISSTFNTNAGKSIYGYFHYKLHPKTYESIALNLHSSIRNASKDEIRQTSRDKSLGIKEKTTDKISREEMIPISSRVLEKYGIWKSKNKSLTPSLY